MGGLNMLLVLAVLKLHKYESPLATSDIGYFTTLAHQPAVFDRAGNPGISGLEYLQIPGLPGRWDEHVFHWPGKRYLS